MACRVKCEKLFTECFTVRQPGEVTHVPDGIHAHPHSVRAHLSLPERLQRSPLRNLTLEALRQRNTALDALFYDVKVITPEEAFYISGSLAAEGSIMIVPPSGGGALTLCETLEEFALRGGGDAQALAVAGIGGSALGAAAFARNVADAIDAPVAVVISGYGLADIITEAFGGHVFFGHLKGLRPVFQMLDDFAGRPKFGAADMNDDETSSRTSLDTRTVRALLCRPPLLLPPACRPLQRQSGHFSCPS